MTAELLAAREQAVREVAAAMARAHHGLIVVAIGRVNASLPEDEWRSAPPPMDPDEWEPEAAAAIDGLLAAGWLSPELLAERERAAEQRGRDAAAEAIEAAPWFRKHICGEKAAALARGSQTAPSATENAETGGGA